MAMMGQGVLAIWNGIAPGHEADFLAWHVREHIPERVGLPGFVRGRRYVSTNAQPAYFNFYETADPGVLTSPGYKARLDAPSDWTRQVVRHFTDTSRTICRVAASRGAGEAGWVETFRLFGAVGEGFAASAADALAGMLDQPGVVAFHLLQGEEEASRGGSAEKAMRAQPDEVVGWIVVVEAVDREALDALRGEHDVEALLRRAGAGGEIRRGTYRLQFSLTHAELNGAPGDP